jgi:NTE family protein
MPISPDAPVRPGDVAAPRPVSFGLQGGGACGAFTGGVLDRLLDDDRLVFDGISGTGAQAALRRFWTGLSGASRFSPVQRTPLDYLLGRWTLESSPGYHMMQMMSVVMGPSSCSRRWK